MPETLTRDPETTTAPVVELPVLRTVETEYDKFKEARTRLVETAKKSEHRQIRQQLRSYDGVCFVGLGLEIARHG